MRPRGKEENILPLQFQVGVPNDFLIRLLLGQPPPASLSLAFSLSLSLSLPKNQLYPSLFWALPEGIPPACLPAWDHPQTAGSVWTGGPNGEREHSACFQKRLSHLGSGSCTAPTPPQQSSDSQSLSGREDGLAKEQRMNRCVAGPCRTSTTTCNTCRLPEPPSWRLGREQVPHW